VLSAASAIVLLLACRYKLSLLHRPSNQTPPTSITFKDFSEDKAMTKAKKAAASKGFGAASAAAKQASAAAAVVATELTAEQLGEILSCNAYGDDHLDGPLTTCRGSEQGSIVGEHLTLSTDWQLGSMVLQQMCQTGSTDRTPELLGGSHTLNSLGAAAVALNQPSEVVLD
jgi:hypothetical protein